MDKLLKQQLFHDIRDPAKPYEQRVTAASKLKTMGGMSKEMSDYVDTLVKEGERTRLTTTPGGTAGSVVTKTTEQMIDGLVNDLKAGRGADYRTAAEAMRERLPASQLQQQLISQMWQKNIPEWTGPTGTTWQLDPASKWAARVADIPGVAANFWLPLGKSNAEFENRYGWEDSKRDDQIDPDLLARMKVLDYLLREMQHLDAAQNRR